MNIGANHGRCLKWAAFGLALGLGAVAHGQDPGAAAVAQPDWLTALGSSGLPAVLAWGFFQLGRTGVPVVVQIHREDRELLVKLVEKEK